jgi:hypothetical protein
MGPCTECGRPSLRLRKDRCNACYMRLYRNGEVAAGARCAACGERRRQVLQHVRLGGDRPVLCGNCALVLSRARPRPPSLADLAHRVARERRRLADRRRPTAAALVEARRGRRFADRLPSPPPLDPAVD